jgi:hypothetical protein
VTVRLVKPAALALLPALFAVVLITAPGPLGPREAQSVGNKAGGRAVAHYPGGKRIRSAAITSKAPKAQISRLNHGAGEPTLAFNKKGDAFFPAAEIALRNTVDVMRTTDNGKTWKNVSPNLGGENTHATTLDPYVWADERTGRIYTIDLTVACSILSWTDDAGKSWTTNPLACGVPVNDHQTLFGGAPATSSPINYESVLYYCWNNVASSYCSKSLDGGLVWTATGSPAYEGAGDDGFCGGLHGHGVVGPDGTVFLPREYCNRAYVAISKDEGLTWTRVRVAKMPTSGGSDTSVAVDKAGNVYYMFVGGKDLLPYLVVSKNDGKTWSDPMMIGAPGLREANLPSVDALGNGKIAFSYMGSENVQVKKDERDYTTATWNGYIGMANKALKKRPVIYTGTVNAKNDPIYRQKCGPGRCGAVFDFIDIEIAPDGTPWAPYVDACVLLCAKGGVANDGDEGITGRLVGGPSLK